jgi:hypothetical protein
MTARGRGAIRGLWSLDPAPVIEARRRALTRIDMSSDPLPPPCRIIVGGFAYCDRPAVLGLKRPDALTIVYVCAKHVSVGERSLI